MSYRQVRLQFWKLTYLGYEEANLTSKSRLRRFWWLLCSTATRLSRDDEQSDLIAAERIDSTKLAG